MKQISVALLLTALCASSAAQNYPTKSIHFLSGASTLMPGTPAGVSKLADDIGTMELNVVAEQ
jgi:hypothetical protein